MLDAILIQPPAQIASANARAPDDDRGRLLGHSRHGRWQGEARYVDPVRYADHAVTCAIASEGATLTQARLGENSLMEARWDFQLAMNGEQRPLVVEWIQVGRRRYSLAYLPWRLSNPTSSGFVTSVEAPMLAFRFDQSRQWLPLAYLTEDMFEADSFTIGYHFDDSESRSVSREKLFRLDGFVEVAKWCGRQLLFDRQDEEQVRDFTR